VEVARFVPFLAGDEEVFLEGDFDFFFPLALFFGLGEAEEELDRVFEFDLALGFGDALFFDLLFDFAFGLGEADFEVEVFLVFVFLAGDRERDLDFAFSAFFFRDGLVFERPRLTGDLDLFLLLLGVPRVPAFFEFFVVRLGLLVVVRLGDRDLSSPPTSCFRCSLPSSVSL